jgi:outer membrane protein assembly factor BamB
VSELNSAGKPRWQFTDLRSPTDAQLLSGHRILLAELQGMQVTERDLKGRVLWRMPVVNGLGCQRLLNGNTFCVARDQLLELDRKGKESFTYRRPAFDIVAARKLASGEIICVLASGTCLRLDATGKELSSFGVGIIGLGSAEVLSSGRVLIAQTAQNRVAEFDRDGKLIWEASCPAPFSATRAANGHTLVTSQNYQRVSELDPSGKIVWDYRSAGRPIKAWRY